MKASKGKQEIPAHMDDIKIHAPNKKAAKLIKDAIKESASELSLLLNSKKKWYIHQAGLKYYRTTK